MNKTSSTADDILASARSLLVGGGYNGFSYADIADMVGIRKPSIHHHFPSKAALVTTLVARYRQAAAEGMQNLERAIPAPRAQLQAYVEYWKACIGDASAPFCVCAMLASELPALPEEISVEVNAFFRYLSGWLTRLFERGVEAGDIVLDGSARVEAETFMATVHGAMMSARAYGDTAVFGSIMDAQLRRLTPRR